MTDLFKDDEFRSDDLNSGGSQLNRQRPGAGSSKSHENREILFLILAVVSSIVFGTLGYEAIEGWNWFDSFYMTVITLATIGYGEVHPLDNAGRAFTIVLIFLGVGVASVVLSTLTRKLLDRHLGWFFAKGHMQEKIDKLDGHTIFCGYGRISRFALQYLQRSGEPLLVVDGQECRVEEARQAGYLALQGDATLDETLQRAGIRRAKRLVTLLPKDADNLYVVLTSREQNPGLFIVSRSEDEPSEHRLVRAGANRIISPSRAGAQRLASGLLRPSVSEFIELAVSSNSPGLQIEEIKIPDNSPVHGRTLQDTELRQRTNVIVAAIVSADGQMHFNPSGETVLEANSTLIGLGFKKDFEELERLLLG